MVTEGAHLQEWLALIRSECEELPGLQMTQSQVEELLGLHATVAEALLGALVSAGVLMKTPEGTYARVPTQ